MTPEDRIKQLRPDATPTEAEWLEFRNEAHRSLSRRRVAAIAGGTALLLAVVGGAYAVTRTSNGQSRPDVVGTPTPSGTETPEAPLDPVDRQMPMPLNQWYVESDGKLKPFTYIMYRAETPRKLLEQTIDFVPGPLGEAGVTSAIPEDNKLVYLQEVDGTARVVVRGTFPDQDEFRMAQAQIVYTITQFEGIEKVDLTWEGRQYSGLTREDFHDLLPPIVVEEPYAAQEVNRVFKLEGIANVFEATVSWRLTSEDGDVFKEGFTTATCGSGCWGTFEDRITLERVPGKRIILEVFQSSAEDGSPMNMVQIPLDVRLD